MSLRIMAEKRDYLVLFPFPARGHFIPFLSLAQYLEQKKGLKIIFLSTPLNTKNLRSSLPPDSSISFLDIPFCSSDHGLPPDSENTDELSYIMANKLIEATASESFSDSVRNVICDLVREKDGQLPLAIVTDFLFGWCAEIAHELGTYCAIFSAMCAYSMLSIYSVWLELPPVDGQSDEFSEPVREAPEGRFPGTDSMMECVKKILPRCLEFDALMSNTIEDIDQAALTVGKVITGKPCLAVGPFLQNPASLSRGGKELEIKPSVCTDWLDSKPTRSVLYIAFGSQFSISKSQMMQLAVTLESSSKNFIWVVRPPLEFDPKVEFRPREWLPEGFMERVTETNRGLIIHGWAPQWEILSHRAISAFLSHCGWSSVLEALSLGVPLIGWPIAYDQFYSVRHLEKNLKVCVELARGSERELDCEEAVAKIEEVMGDTEKGKDIKRRAMEVRELFKNAMKDEDGMKGSSVRDLDTFLADAMAMREEKKGMARK